ncbi:Conserved hypothetical membrane protein [Pseudomonas veronii 1YdBTEX2]|uniref:Conserved hypothetical membrane protein n=1 Tax=Pseudomonas veronii 1YdBTEX2 TaxID=1295141 RepID=A0A1D3K8P4_PSEVE|nr:Conserved hypothetical membrane protein [Pseudomonas veronii 1YdBTEX2]
METNTKKQTGDIQLGRLRYTHNRFLLTLACLALAAFIFADIIGSNVAQGSNWVENLTSPQMVWALLLLPIAAFGGLMLKRAGHPDTALKCLIVAAGFISGAVAKLLFAL